MADSPADQELARDLGFLEAYTIGVGTMIGAGIFVLPGIVANNAGPAGMISFAIGGVVSLLTALSLSELATGMPKAGGSYYYVNRAMGSFFGSIVGWSMWAGLMFATAFYMLGFGQYLTFFYGNIPVAWSALGMAFLLIGVNYRGVKEAGALQNLIVILLIGFILVFLSFGVFNIDWSVFRPFNPNGWGAVASTAATVYVSFIGFEVIATSAEEIKDPGRNLPLSMIASVLTPMIFYVLVMLVSTGVLPVAELAGSNIPVADVASEYLGTIGAFMMVVGALLATVSSANASILSAARVNFAMGRDKILTSWLNKIHDKFRTPFRAILITGIVILLLIGIGVGIETLADVASFLYLITYALVHIAVIVMRRAEPEDYNPDFKLSSWAYPTIPLLGSVSCLVIVAQMRPLVMIIGGGIIVLGVLWYFGYAASRAIKPSLVGDAIAARDRTPAPNERYRIVIPVANPETEQHLIQIGGAIGTNYGEAEIVAVSVLEVPRQTSLEQGIQYEDERVQRQQKLLTNARSTAEKAGLGLRTRSIVGHSVSSAVLNVIKEERAQHLVLGWSGKRKPYQHILGSNIDNIVKNASCEITLVKAGNKAIKEIVVLVGTGPNTALAVKRGRQLSSNNKDTTLTLLTVQSPQTEGAVDPEKEGKGLVTSVAHEVGLDSENYSAEVVVSDDVRESLLQAVKSYDTICIGATRSTAVRQALFGSIPEEIGEKAEGTVIITRGREYKPRSVTEGIIERLSR
ncbi:amino acid permease [Aliifodinibius salicampi]|uniref:Amino acid permease n=1 Tax=Fodinibius salicampi TaxID=1920655 RepID=A0ABT3Q0N7_9BACT|nr:amino acid permease [Fodinibius salicampi]MCW9713674.1 amino acid permease [Fodinibius salicampi]